MGQRTAIFIFWFFFGWCATAVVQGQECTAEDQTCQAAKTTEVKIPKGSNAKGLPPSVSFSECNDRTDKCANYHAHGECEKNPGWMIINCPVSCNACELRDPKIRCNRQRLNITEDHVYAPGDMNAMFESIEKDFGSRYGVTVVSTDPWVVTFDNFLTEEEMDAILATNEGKFERSTDTGQANEFGETGRTLSQGRTSSNSWCRGECETHPLVQQVVRKIEEVTRVPSVNFESFQVLRYENGQKYNTHHDMSERQNSLASGPRILTFFLYLSDVEEGGETDFPRIKIRVKPKRGKAVLWPSTYDHEPTKQDARTHHQALPVIKGTKFAANSWIHSHNFEKSNLWGCTGTFDQI